MSRGLQNLLDLLGDAADLWRSEDPADVHRGIALLATLLERAPDDHKSLVLMETALAHERLGRVREAAEALTTAAKIDEDLTELSDVWYRFPIFIAHHRLTKLYPRALRLLRAGSLEDEIIDPVHLFAMLAVPALIHAARGRLAAGGRLGIEALAWVDDESPSDLDWGARLIEPLRAMAADPAVLAALRATPDPGHLRGRTPRDVQDREERRLLVQLAELDIRVRRASHLSFYPPRRRRIGLPLVFRTLLALPLDSCWRLKTSLDDVLRDDAFAASLPEGADRLLDLFERTPASDFKFHLACTIESRYARPRHAPRMSRLLADAAQGPARASFAGFAAAHAPEPALPAIRAALRQVLDDPASLEPQALLEALGRIGTRDDVPLARAFTTWNGPNEWTTKDARKAAQAALRHLEARR